MGPSGHFYSFLFICGLGVVVVKIWDRLYLGRAPRTKETVRFSCVVSGYPTPMIIPQVDRLSTGPPGLGHHRFIVTCGIILM